MVPPDTIPDEAKIEMNLAVLLFTTAVSIAAAILSGLAPALHVSGREVASPLKETGRSLAGGKRQRLLRGGLVVGEVALSLMLLVGASLMIRTLFAMEHLDLGIRADRMLTMQLPVAQDRWPDEHRIAFLAELLPKVESLPGVLAAGINTGLHPLGNWQFPVEMPGNAQQDDRSVLVGQTNENYFRAMGIGLAAGCLFTPHEVANRVRVAVANRAFVQRYCANRDPIGRIVRVPRLSEPPSPLKDPAFEIVGVVNNAVNDITNNETMRELSFPYTIFGAADQLVVRSKEGQPAWPTQFEPKYSKSTRISRLLTSALSTCCSVSTCTRGLASTCCFSRSSPD